jgi:homoserine/homoserine lactone efflux protein
MRARKPRSNARSRRNADATRVAETPEIWAAFFVAAWLICLSPGPGAISSMSTGARFPYRRAVWNIVGLQSAILLQVMIVAVGIGALFVASATAFAFVQWFGVLYLIYLGVRQWRTPSAFAADTAHPTSHTRRELFVRGFLVNMANPKGIVFLLAVLPQFVIPSRGSLAGQYAILGATLITVDSLVMSGYTVIAGHALRWLRNERQQRWLNRGFGALFILAGLALAMFRRTVSVP